MKRKIVSIITIILILLLPLSSYGSIDIDAKSALLMDYNSGEIIYALNEHEKLAPASITKIMTLLLTMEALNTNKIKLTDKVNISEHASQMGGTSVYLDAGEIQTVENLIKAVSIRSANDASVALAEYIAGSEEAFVQLMNGKAKELGMKNTNFTNASGLPGENHYTTAYDIGLMSRQLLRHKKIVEYLTIYMDDMEVGKSKASTQTMVNTNRLIKDYEGATGIKTGYTSEAKHCISASAKKGDLQLIAVIMGADSSKVRFTEAAKLLDHGFSNFESITVGLKGDVFVSIPVEKGNINQVDLMLERDSFILVPKGDQIKVEKKINHPEFLTAPIEPGTPLGNVEVIVDGKIIDKVNLVAKSLVERGNIVNILKKVWANYLFNQ